MALVEMAEAVPAAGERAVPEAVASDWSSADLGLYLGRCQIDTPDRLIRATWDHVSALRGKIGTVVDFGAGDGRFSKYGSFDRYLGFEIDGDRYRNVQLQSKAQIVHSCAFAQQVTDADVCIGNPPFVRNQDLPSGWRAEVADQLCRRSGVLLSGLANAWQYFFLLALVSTKPDGLCALVIPYEWVSRPSSKVLRDFIRDSGWNVTVYRLVDTAFSSVLTTASITVVDKATKQGEWRFLEETTAGTFKDLPTESASSEGHISYMRPGKDNTYRAKRGLSPGTQKILTLTEGARVREGLEIGRDVAPCITSLRHLPLSCTQLDATSFKRYFRDEGAKCWLIRADVQPSEQLATYLNAIPKSDRQTSTCLQRDLWWKFKMPSIPDVLIATSFKGKFPKTVSNSIRARAVGGVAGIYGVPNDEINPLVEHLTRLDIRDRIIPHANGLRKIEINQLNSILTWTQKR